MKRALSTSMKIGVLMGGWSWEREISLRSGKMVANSLRRQGFKVVEIDVDYNIVSTLKKAKIDIAFVALHGVPGEDGTIQGLLDILGIPYTGSGVLASSISINKIITKKVLIASGITVPKYFYGNFNLNRIKKTLGPPPWVIKPVSSGSSLGVNIVNKAKELKSIFEKVKREYKDAFIEEFIHGPHITVGILADKPLPVLELAPKSGFYNYEAKYTKGLTDFIIPARLPNKVYKEAQEIAIRTHNAIGCSGFSRVDMIVSDNTPYVLEINSIPGLTDISDLPAEAEYAGISYDDVIYKILECTVRQY
ncbi:MAG: D-alanine--D-alanine ligase [bacterium]|nr:D-alanine--D-alanine ligase [bacterium]